VLVNGNEPFVFPSQVQQVFYSDDSSNPWWKVILHKEPWSKRMFLNTYGEYISTKKYGSVLDAWGAMPNAPTIPSNVGAILLFWEESLLFNELRQLNLERQFVSISKDMSTSCSTLFNHSNTMLNDFRRKCLCSPTSDVLSHLDTMKQKKFQQT
jgi:hypothetical protein